MVPEAASRPLVTPPKFDVDEPCPIGRRLRLVAVMSFSLLTDDALCEVARRDMPLLLALQATCKHARRVLSIWLTMQVSVRLQVSLGHRGP